MKAELDRQALGLDLNVPADQFVPYSFAAERAAPPAPVAGTGGFLDYDLLYQAGSDVDQRMDGRWNSARSARWAHSSPA